MNAQEQDSGSDPLERLESLVGEWREEVTLIKVA